jgi:hypothetical protein
MLELGAEFKFPRAASLICTDRPYSLYSRQLAAQSADYTYKSSKHVWHTFLIFAQVVQISVFLNLEPDPGFQRKTVNGRVQILHS